LLTLQDHAKGKEMTQEQIYKFALETAGKLIEKLEVEVSLLRTLNGAAARYSIFDDTSVKINGDQVEVDGTKANADFARSIHNDHSELPVEDKLWQEILKADKVVKEGWIVVSIRETVNTDNLVVNPMINEIFKTKESATAEIKGVYGSSPAFSKILKITYEE
jgi:hypothetical protein